MFVNKSLLQGMRLAMYIVGQEETVGESSVSSGCWGEDSDHEYEWARRTPTFVAPIRFFCDIVQRHHHLNIRNTVKSHVNAGWIARFLELHYAQQ